MKTLHIAFIMFAGGSFLLAGEDKSDATSQKARDDECKALSAAVASGNAVEVDDSALDEERGESLTGMFKAAKDMGRAALSGNKANVQRAKDDFILNKPGDPKPVKYPLALDQGDLVRPELDSARRATLK